MPFLPCAPLYLLVHSSYWFPLCKSDWRTTWAVNMDSLTSLQIQQMMIALLIIESICYTWPVLSKQSVSSSFHVSELTWFNFLQGTDEAIRSHNSCMRDEAWFKALGINKRCKKLPSVTLQHHYDKSLGRRSNTEIFIFTNALLF